MMNFKTIISLIALQFFLFNNIIAQKDTIKIEESPLSVSGDIVSSFVWRGAVVSPTVNIQPSVSYTKNGFTFGAWGTADSLGSTSEIDIFMSYQINGFSITFTDYFWHPGEKYFDYSNVSSAHNMEIGLSYELQKFPLKIYGGTMVYGEDKKHIYDVSETDTIKNNYSTYLELSYTINMKKGKSLNIFAGATPFTGMYGNKFNIIYAGFTATKEIKFSDKYSLPLYATFALNPQNEKYFVVLGFKL